MKAILVLDEMPCACVECPLCVHAKFDYYFDKTICMANGDKIQDTREVQRMCPIKPLPNKLQANWYGEGYKEGFNACLEEIEK